MYSKIKLFGHPVQTMLVSFPIAMYALTLLAFVIYAIQGDPMWFRVGFVANTVGVFFALAAMVPGYIDWAFRIPPGAAAKDVALIHMIYNVAALIFFAANAMILAAQWTEPRPSLDWGILLALAGILCTIAGVLYGSTLVQTHEVGVELSREQERLEPKSKQPARRGSVVRQI